MESYKALQQAVLDLGLPDDSRLVVAVSGGADSVALLHTLAGLARTENRHWALLVAHVNHGLRQEEGERDEMFVRRLAGELGVPLEVARVDTIAGARAGRLSIETAARDLRYRELRRILERSEGQFIVTGHTQDDQAETVLLHLLRGAGIRGLSGMAPSSGQIVRPFLTVPHQTIVHALDEQAIEYVVDSSNFDEAFQRNRLRLQVVPALRSLQPDVVSTIARAAALLRADNDLIEQEVRASIPYLGVSETDGAVAMDRSAWLALHPSVGSALLRSLVERLLGSIADIEEAHVASIGRAIEAGGSMVGRLPRELAVYIDGPRVVLRRGPVHALPPLPTLEMNVPGEVRNEAGQLRARVSPVTDRVALERMVAVCGPFHGLCDAVRLGNRLTVRSRLPGDRIAPLSSRGSRKLQDLFVDHHIPREARDQIPVISNGTRIVWIPGIALDREVRVDATTVSLTHLVWQPGSRE